MASNQRYLEDPFYNGNANKGTEERPPRNKNIAGFLEGMDSIAEEMRYETR